MDVTINNFTGNNPTGFDTSRFRGNYSICQDDWSVDQDYAGYQAADHALWRQLYAEQLPLVKQYAAAEFITGLESFDCSDGLPDLAKASQLLKKRSNWEIVVVPGIIPVQPFFHHLANRRFPVTNWLRTVDELGYLVEPDIFHDFFGHVPLLMNKVFADFVQEYGKLALKALELGVDSFYSRLFWFTVEFGLIHENGEVKAYGAGILSSPIETNYSMNSTKPHWLGYDMLRIMHTDNRIDELQPNYFVIDSYQQLFESTLVPMQKVIDQLKDVRLIERGEIIASDVVIKKGKD
ncbi:MAG: phenylalanine 4-monooxygenase [Alphaproteobacteria bacterium]